MLAVIKVAVSTTQPEFRYILTSAFLTVP